MNKEKSVCLITLIEGKLINFRENMSVIKKEVISTIMDVASRLKPGKRGKRGRGELDTAKWRMRRGRPKSIKM